MNYESILLPLPGRRQLPLPPPAPAPPRLGGNRRETDDVLARPGNFTVSLEPLASGAHDSGTHDREIGYTITIHNTGWEPLLDVEIAETRVGPGLPSEPVVFRADTPPILPGESRVIPRLKISSPERISILTTVMARGPRAGRVYRSCHLDVEGRPG